MVKPPVRTVHVVGSVPADSPKDAFGILREELGDRLGPTTPDGQTGDRLNWIYRIVEALRGHPHVELIRDGTWSDYSDIPAFRVRKGRRLRWVDLDYFAALERSWPDFVEFNTGASRTLQVGIPSPAGLAYVTFGMNPARAATNLAVFREATIREIAAMHTHTRGEVVFQLELPIELATISRLPLAARKVMATRLASEVLRLVESAPRKARFGLHICLGDLNQRALANPDNTRPAVLLANAIMADWPPGRSLDYVHVGLAAGAEPPTLEPDYYAPLKTLWIPPEVRFVGGFIHEKRSVEELLMIRDELEHILDRSIDVAASCGLGRRDPTTARQNLRLARAVAETGDNETPLPQASTMSNPPGG